MSKFTNSQLVFVTWVNIYVEVNQAILAWSLRNIYPCQDPVSSEHGWAPAPLQPGVYYDRDMEYIRDQVSSIQHPSHCDIIFLSIFQAIYGVKDSGELVPPTAQASIPSHFSPEEPVHSDVTERYPAAEYNLVYAIDKR